MNPNQTIKGTHKLSKALEPKKIPAAPKPLPQKPIRTVGDLIHALQCFSPATPVFMSSDEEGNEINGVFEAAFDSEGGVTLWPHQQR